MSQPLKILIVDDNRFYRQALYINLSSSNQVIVVGEATNGEDAIKLIGQLQPDVVLLDVEMPGIDGLQVVTTINQFHPSVKTIMLSAHHSKDMVLEALRKGAQGYLVKGITGSKELLRAIQMVMRGQAVLSPPMTGWLLDEMTTVQDHENSRL